MIEELGIPRARLSIIDTVNVWFLAGTGFFSRALPLLHPPSAFHLAFASQPTIETPFVWTCEDATQHPILASHPMVVRRPYARFFACTPLISYAHNHVIGTVAMAAMAPYPRLSPEKEERFMEFAAELTNILQRDVKRLTAPEEGGTPLPALWVDISSEGWKIMRANTRWEELTGVEEGLLVAQPGLLHVLLPESDEEIKELRQAVEQFVPGRRGRDGAVRTSVPAVLMPSDPSGAFIQFIVSFRPYQQHLAQENKANSTTKNIWIMEVHARVQGDSSTAGSRETSVTSSDLMSATHQGSLSTGGVVGVAGGDDGSAAMWSDVLGSSIGPGSESGCGSPSAVRHSGGSGSGGGSGGGDTSLASGKAPISSTTKMTSSSAKSNDGGPFAMAARPSSPHTATATATHGGSAGFHSEHTAHASAVSAAVATATQESRQSSLPLMHGRTTSNTTASSAGDTSTTGANRPGPGADPLIIPPRLSSLTLGRLLGQGSFGTVYAGKWGDIPVAVKVVEGAVGTDWDRMQWDVRGEAFLAQTVRHENVMRTLDWCYPSDGLSGRIWIVQELCDRGTLSASLKSEAFRDGKKGNAPKIKAILETALDIARGTRHLHSLGLLHADLSSNNVLLSTKTNSRSFVAKVSDLGMSRFSDRQQQTRTVGTVSHMSPEAMIEGDVSAASDSYSFGCILWELYTGKHAWERATLAQVIFHVTVKGETLKMPDDAPEELKTLAEECLSLEKEKRPSFETIVPRLEAMLAAESSN